MARTADVKRGWAKFCSKSCKAVRQEQRTGQYKSYMNRDFHGGEDFIIAYGESGHDCNKGDN